MAKATARYRGIMLAPLQDRAVSDASTDSSLAVKINVADATAPLTPGEANETYSLDVTAAGCTIDSPTVWGALRGLETLSQLVELTATGSILQLLPVSVSDSPRFGWRGLMIDTGRNYLTTTTIKMALDTMVQVRLFHQ